MRNVFVKSSVGMIIFFVAFSVLNYFTTERQELILILSLIQCTLTVAIFIMVYNFCKEWKENQSQDENKT